MASTSTFGELDAQIATTKETIGELSALIGPRSSKANSRPKGAARSNLRPRQSDSIPWRLTQGTALGELARQLEEEKVQRDRLSAQATAAAEQRARGGSAAF